MVKIIIMESVCELVKIIAAALYHSLDAVRNFWEKKCKTITFVHKMILNELSHHMSLN